MSYATNLQFAERSGLGIHVYDENVGTGDGATLTYDLDNDNVTASSYTLSYAASGSNSFTALTETTHYSVDTSTGRILLTSAGATALSTNILYASYWYVEGFNNSTVTDLLTLADDEIDKLTGRLWDGPTSIVEYHSGRRNLGYPTTDAPFTHDWDEPEFIALRNHSVRAVDFVYFLNEPQPISLFYNYDDSLTTYTDKTTAINSTTQTPFTLWASTPATSDIIYIGSSAPFLGLDVNLSTLGTGSPAIDWEYYDGTTWSDITETDTDTGAALFKANGKFTWTYPYGWTTTTVNSSSSYYWIRGKLTSIHTIAPIISTITILDSVNTVLEPRQYLFKASGRLNFMGASVQDGTENIRVDYKYGETSTPTYIAQLSILIASVNAYVNLSGGSYNDATRYELGTKAVTIGEVYVNIREVLDQFKKRIAEILDMIGRRADVSVI